MGMIFGKIDVETPKYEVLDKGEGFEVRKYPPAIVAEVACEGEFQKGDDNSFMILAGYIGALSAPKNVKPDSSDGEKIAMTSPVITTQPPASEKIAMTAPVLTERGDRKGVMQFILPSKYSMASIPRPTDPRVALKEIEGKKYGVVTFNGYASPRVVNEQASGLRAALEKAGLSIAGDFVLARFNPPFTIPHFRKNEVMFPVE